MGDGWREVDLSSVMPASEAIKKAPKLFGVPTGVEGLDDLFFITVIEDGKPKKVPLGGIPYRAVVNVTGIPDTGKSLLAEQFAVKQASLGYPVAFVTVESPAPFVSQGLLQRANAMGIDWNSVEDNVILIDAASSSRLREDTDVLLDTLAYVIREYDTKNVVIDSITGLFEAREMLARQIVRRIFNFLKKWGQTAILVSQKRSSHEEESAEAAGGYAVSHILDGTIVLSKRVIKSLWEERVFGIPIGDLLRTIRIDGMRLCGHDTRTHLLEITETGLVKVGPPLSEIVRRRREEVKE
ncbi:MAG: KaiC domain-containing protein [Candidatus Diapherotrites archaeon]|nr:KaiC domain-containing protein [Candidatus Diapherotrites archaeon]